MSLSLQKLIAELSISHRMLELNLDVLSLLAQEHDLSKGKVKQAMIKGALWYQSANKKLKTRRIRRLPRQFSAGDKLFLYYDPAVLQQQPEPALLIHDADSYSVWYKPYGMYSQGSKWGDHCTIQRWAEQHLEPQRPAIVVHRLDRATSGLIILAHKKTAAIALSAMFEQHKLEKVYEAVVMGDCSHIQSPLTITEAIDGRKALSHVSFIKGSSCGRYSLLSVSIDTGRKHQIRKHLSQVGFPIIGDRLYGSNLDLLDKNLQLVAKSLSFTCPITGLSHNFTLPKELRLSIT